MNYKNGIITVIGGCSSNEANEDAIETFDTRCNKNAWKNCGNLEQMLNRNDDDTDKGVYAFMFSL